jgi:predicted GNAT family N-acyltransferase
MAYHFEPLDPSRHDRAGFRCTSAALTSYLRSTARKDAERHLAATFVMVDAASPAAIIGYYTLSNFTVELAELPAALRDRIPRYPRLPATLIGRLARDERCAGTGGILLIDALLRAYQQTRTSGSLAVVAEAKAEAARRFYLKHGFAQLGSEPNRFYLPMAAIRLLSSAAK